MLSGLLMWPYLNCLICSDLTWPDLAWPCLTCPYRSNLTSAEFIPWRYLSHDLPQLRPELTPSGENRWASWPVTSGPKFVMEMTSFGWRLAVQKYWLSLLRQQLHYPVSQCYFKSFEELTPKAVLPTLSHAGLWHIESVIVFNFVRDGSSPDRRGKF